MKILIAVEELEYAEALAEFAIRCEGSNDAEFQILHVVDPLIAADFAIGFSKEQLESISEERHRLGKCLVMNIGTKLSTKFPQAKITETVADGHPKSVIIDRARDWNADIVIMGSHGRGGIERIFLGSVSLAVLTHAPCSVAIIRLPGQARKKKKAAAEDSAADSTESKRNKGFSAGVRTVGI